MNYRRSTFSIVAGLLLVALSAGCLQRQELITLPSSPTPSSCASRDANVAFSFDKWNKDWLCYSLMMCVGLLTRTEPAQP